MIELRLSAADFTQIRFAYSPLAEAINSLYMLHTGQVYPLHRGWAEAAQARLRSFDTTLLQAIVPPRPPLLTLPLDPRGPATTPERQLQLVANWSPELLRTELEGLWPGLPMPQAARQVIADGPAGARRLAAALAVYWDAVIAPHWDGMRALLDAEIGYRARQLVLGGIGAVLNDLHPQLQLDQAALRLYKPAQRSYDVAGKGVLLIPEVFAGSHLLFDPASLGQPAIGYAPRGLGTVWQDTTTTGRPAGDPLSTLMGKNRTAILRRTQLPATTTGLARELGVSGATVSVHLATRSRCGLLTSWRSGRHVLYQRTALATSILSATASSGRG